MTIPHDSLQEIERLQEQNLNLKAYELAKNHGEFMTWEGGDALLLGSHLAYNLGAPEASFRLTSRAWHRHKAEPKTTFYYAMELMSRRGPLPALMFARKQDEFSADDKLTSWWYSLLGQLHASLRDFAAAAQWHAKAAEVCPDESWVWVARSFTLEQQDRYEEALEAAMKGLELAPHRRASVSAAAHFFTLLERDDEALELLVSSTEKVENAWMLKQLSELQTELGLHIESYSTLERAMELLPMLESETAKWLYGSLSDSAYLTGDFEKATDYAAKAGGEFHEKIGENLGAANAESKRIQLDLGFVRQHHVTCAPATLSNIGRYWKKKASHLELVEEMCYDGTPSYKERVWAEANGWRTREFTLNQKNAKELLERGVPMTLATIYPGGGHLQAIIGLDERRGTYLIRDPYYRRTGEFLAADLESQQRSSGPRVMALVPEENKQLLENLNEPLAESEIYDVQFSVESALERHDRQEAGLRLKEMESRYPNHRLTLSARWSVANYDTNLPGVRSSLQALLEMFPEDVNLRLNNISVFAQSTIRDDRLNKLEEYSKAKATDPMFWQMFGYELSLDAKQHDRALRWLFRSLRHAPGNALTYRFLADILWSKRRFAEAADLYRIAASLNDKDENLSYSYFVAMRHLKQEDEAVYVLKDRVRRFIKQSGMPVYSLFRAQREMGLAGEAFEMLDEALSKRPLDGELHLFAADAKARFGRTEEVNSLLKKAEKISSRPQWLRVAATSAHLRGDLEEALALWRDVLDADPSAYDAHENIAFLTKGLEGALAAKDYLRRACRKFPMNRSLQVLRLQYLDEEPGEAIAVLRDLLRSDPSDTWSHRELSSWYAQVGKFDRSLDAAEAAVAADPNDPVSRWFLGKALESLGRYDEAAAEYESGVRNWADHAHSISSWIALLRTKEQKLKALDVIWAELRRLSITGDGLFAFRTEASRFLDAKELLNRLRDFQLENKRSWFAASAVIEQLVDMGETNDALAAASAAVERFPLVHQVWLDLALVHKLTGNHNEEIAALRNAVAMNPGWSYGSQQLSEALQRAGKFVEAKDALISALSRLPFDHHLHGYLAEVLWKLNERDKAIETLKYAVTLEPNYDWAWNAIRTWADESGNRHLPVQLAREATERRPRDARAWVNLAEMLETGAFSQEQLDAAEQALKIDPDYPAALAIKANSLASARRYEEAITVCRTVMPDGHRPEQLQFVEAGIEMGRGRLHRGIEIMQALTRTSPGYLPGWARLADLYRENPARLSDYLEVARQVVRLAPREATAYGYLAEACMKSNRKDEAREALHQAVVLDPHYRFAATELFRILTEDGDTEGAERLAETLCRSAAELGLPIALEVASGKGDRERVLQLLAEQLRSPDAIKEKVDQAFEKVKKLFDRKDLSLEKALRDLCEADGVNPIAGRYLIGEVWRKKSRRECEETLSLLAERRALWAEAAARYLEILASEKPGEIVGFIDRNGNSLSESTETWASVGYYLSNASDSERMHQWYSGWEKRSDLRPWMLWNYSIVLRRDGMDAEADRVNRAAIDLPYDDSVNVHLTSVGLAAFKQGNIDEAMIIFSNTNPVGMTGWDKFFYDLLADALSAANSIANGDITSARSITSGIVDNVIQHDRKRSDRIVKYSSEAVLKTLLPSLGRWYAFWLRSKLFYYSLG